MIHVSGNHGENDLLKYGGRTTVLIGSWSQSGLSGSLFILRINSTAGALPHTGVSGPSLSEHPALIGLSSALHHLESLASPRIPAGRNLALFHGLSMGTMCGLLGSAGTADPLGGGCAVITAVVAVSGGRKGSSDGRGKRKRRRGTFLSGG
ncbi:unnamed protein product [Gadus morhua 'NCC']